jgi:hypothetical protein
VPGFGWQDAVVLALVALAIAWLVRARLRRRKRPTPFCGDCPGCVPGDNAAALRPLPHEGRVIPIADARRRLTRRGS